jgi:CRP/FNR family transcriptional regulator, cyclic AMP receptor protein
MSTSMTNSISDRLDSLFSSSKTTVYAPGEIILSAEEKPPGVLYLEDGFVKMNTVFNDGRELTLNIFKPGTYFPMTWVISNIENSYFYYALTTVKIKRLPKSEFTNFLNSNPDILWDLTSRILVGLNGILSNVQHLLSGNSYNRVVSAILLSARRFGKKNSAGQISVQVPLTHQDIANIAGITRETASLCIGKMMEKGLIIHRYRHTTVLSLPLLEKESQMGSDNDFVSAV